MIEKMKINEKKQEIRAWKRSLKLWNWIVDNKALTKINYPKYHEIEDMAGKCHLCDYYYYHSNQCRICKLGCQNKGSDWRKWANKPVRTIFGDTGQHQYFSDKVRLNAAKRLRDKIAKRLKELQEELNR